MDTDERHIEAIYPLLEDSAEPPGKSVPSTVLPDSHQWIGVPQWRTRRGPAFVLWSFGRPHGALNARYPDGSRGMIRDTLDHGLRRRSLGQKRWIYGTMDIEVNDVTFHDGVQPTYEPPALGLSDLEGVLARDRDFLASLADDRFAKAVYAVFRNRTFIEAQSGQTWMCGDRQAAHLVANLRGLGESYHDYFLSEFQGAWPDDEQARVKCLRDSIALLEAPVSASIPRFAVGTVVHFDGESETIRNVEHAREVEVRWRDYAARHWRDSERTRHEQASSLRAALAEIEQQPNRDVYELLRAHLARVGWRAETDDDRERAKAAARLRDLKVLQMVKQLEIRPKRETPSWALPILDRRKPETGLGFTRFVSTAILAGLSEDEREVERGRVPQRLDDLAVGGQIGEAEYNDLSARLSGGVIK